MAKTRTKSATAKSIGRPSAYKPEYDELARKFCLLHATDKTLAEFFEVAEHTIDNWKIKHPSFLQSIKAGKDKADAEVADSLYNKAVGYSRKAHKIFMPAGADKPVYAEYEEYYPPDTAAAFIWLKNRAGWRDRQDVQHTGAIAIEFTGDFDGL